VFDLAHEPIPPGALTDVDVVFHLAAKVPVEDLPGESAAAYTALNVGGTRRLLEACGTSKVRRLVFFSSVKAVGEGGETRIGDDVVPDPVTAYGRSKLEGERLVLYGRYVPEPVVLRLSPVYGPGGRGNLIKMIDAVRTGRLPPVPDNRNRRSMVHVDDVVAAAKVAAKRGEAVGRAFFVTDGIDYSTRDLYEALAHALGIRVRRGLPIWVFHGLALAGDVARRVSGRRMPFDSSGLEKLFRSAYYDVRPLMQIGYSPQWTLTKALPTILGDDG
jgi:nucleoside-diphosphate-sugar epimerase